MVEKLTAREFDGAIQLILQEAIWIQKDLERAADYENTDLKKCIIDNLVASALVRMNRQIEFIKQNA